MYLECCFDITVLILIYIKKNLNELGGRGMYGKRMRKTVPIFTKLYLVSNKQICGGFISLHYLERQGGEVIF